MRSGLYDNSRSCKFGSWNIPVGKFPSNPQQGRLRDVKEDIFAKTLGSGEDMITMVRSSCTRLVKFCTMLLKLGFLSSNNCLKGE